MKKEYIRAGVAAICAAILVSLVLLALSRGETPKPVRIEAAPQALSVNAASAVLLGFGVTQTFTGPAFLLPSHSADCYEYLGMTGTQTVTLSLQHSADTVNWQSLYSFAEASHSGASWGSATAFTPTVNMFGSYARGIVALSAANPVTASLLCVFR